MLDQFTFHDMQFTWLKGVRTLTDGGVIFGPLPKAIWSQAVPYGEDNRFPGVADPILIQSHGKNILIDASFNTKKLDEKTRKILGIPEDDQVEESLASLGLSRADIDYVLMTHMHNDHASGLTRYGEDGGLTSTFPNAQIHMSAAEWDEVRNPNARTKATYLKENWEAIEDQVHTFQEELEVIPGIRMIKTGGHSRGHAIIEFKQKGECLLHMADLLVTNAQTRPTWVPAVDDYPVQSMEAKEKYLVPALKEGVPFLFYHDAFYRMIQYTADGKGIVQGLKASRQPLVQLTDEQERFPRLIDG